MSSQVFREQTTGARVVSVCFFFIIIIIVIIIIVYNF